MLANLLPGGLPEQNLRPSEVLGDERPLLGSHNAPYKLVMFGDYQCPPCRGEWPKVEQAFASRQGKLAVYFHNFPLISIHPQAFDAAVVAEKAKQKGNILAVHRQLYARPDALLDLKGLMKSNGINADAKQADALRARRNVARGMASAASMGIRVTPTLLLIDPEDHVFLLPNIDSLPAM